MSKKMRQKLFRLNELKIKIKKKNKNFILTKNWTKLNKFN